MVIDTSALLAILQDEPERRAFNEAIEAADSRRLSTATWVETSIIVESRYGAEGLRDLDLLISKASIDLVSVDVEQAHIARLAFSRFGKGRHPAGLNYGTVSRMRLPRPSASRSFTRAETLRVPTSPPRPPPDPRDVVRVAHGTMDVETADALVRGLYDGR